MMGRHRGAMKGERGKLTGESGIIGEDLQDFVSVLEDKELRKETSRPMRGRKGYRRGDRSQRKKSFGGLTSST